MPSFLLRRLLAIFPVSFAVVSLVGLMIHAIPGDPVDLIAGDFASEAHKAEIRTAMGLDRPIASQILHYYGGIFKGDLGKSLVTHRPVSELIGERILPTVELAVGALFFSCLISIPLGALCAIRKRSWLDFSCMGLTFVGVSMPNFWLGPLLILLFSIHLGWLPVSGRSSPASIVLPILTLGSSLSAVLLRISRSSILEQLKEDYVRTARSKGLSDFKVYFIHVFKNASISLTTVVGLQFGALVTGAIITEKIFDWPGLGTLIAEAIERRDYPVVQGCVFTFSLAFLMTNLFTDALYSVLDPRIRVQD